MRFPQRIEPFTRAGLTSAAGPAALKSSAVAAQPGKWVQQALVAGHAQTILAAADQIRGGLEGLVAEGAFLALDLGPTCVNLFVDDAFKFHGSAFHAGVSSAHRPLYTSPMPPALMLWKILIWHAIPAC
jgi:hypothetical protein